MNIQCFTAVFRFQSVFQPLHLLICSSFPTPTGISHLTVMNNALTTVLRVILGKGNDVKVSLKRYLVSVSVRIYLPIYWIEHIIAIRNNVPWIGKFIKVNIIQSKMFMMKFVFLIHLAPRDDEMSRPLQTLPLNSFQNLILIHKRLTTSVNKLI